MTCIAVVRGQDGVVWMGADSCVTRGRNRSRLSPDAPKVFQLDESVWFGWCGSSYVGIALRCGFPLPERVVSESEDAWLFNRLLPAIRQRLIETGVYSEEVEPDADGWQRGIRGECVLVFGERIYHLSQNCLPVQVADDYFAVGSGEDAALGALHFAHQHLLNLTPEQILTGALNAAAAHAEGVAPPYIILRCDPDPTT